jgi:hypothetical protein
MLTPRLRGALLALVFLMSTEARAADHPTPQESDYVARDFKFTSGDTLPELRLGATPRVGMPRQEGAVHPYDPGRPLAGRPSQQIDQLILP